VALLVGLDDATLLVVVLAEAELDPTVFERLVLVAAVATLRPFPFAVPFAI
jgi:hypothetical protein